MAKGQGQSIGSSSEEEEKKSVSTSKTGEEEKQAIADRIAIVKETFEKNKSLDKKDQKEISRDDMILAGLMPA